MLDLHSDSGIFQPFIRNNDLCNCIKSHPKSFQISTFGTRQQDDIDLIIRRGYGGTWAVKGGGHEDESLTLWLYVNISHRADGHLAGKHDKWLQEAPRSGLKTQGSLSYLEQTSPCTLFLWSDWVMLRQKQDIVALNFLNCMCWHWESRYPNKAVQLHCGDQLALTLKRKCANSISGDTPTKLFSLWDFFCVCISTSRFCSPEKTEDRAPISIFLFSCISYCWQAPTVP